VEVFAVRTVVVFAATATRDVVVGIVIIVIILVRERVRRRPTGDSGTLWPDMWRGDVTTGRDSSIVCRPGRARMHGV